MDKFDDKDGINPLDEIDFEALLADDDAPKTQKQDDELKPMESFEESDDAQYSVDRTQKVKDFIKNMGTIEDDTYIDYDDESTPEYKGEVYFANAPRTHKTDEGESVSLKKKMSKGKKRALISGAVTSISALVVFGIIIFATAFFSITGIRCVNDILALNRSDEEVAVTVPNSASCYNIISLLKDNDLITNQTFCELFASIRHLDTDEYMSGVYYMKASMGLEGMLNLAKAAPEQAETVTISIPEGYTIYQIFQKLENNDVCDASQLYDTLEKISFEYGFIDEMDTTKEKYQKLEGYFFPDTYDFFVGENPSSVIKKFLNNFESKWKKKYDVQAKKLGYTTDQIVTIASIIQREAADAEQMKQIASVLENRLNNIASYPRLECDSTSQYITDYVKPVIGEKESDKYISLYDTYDCRGLPVGAICNPGVDAIEAALFPEDSDNYYFMHDNSGNIYLAETFAEHEENNQEVLLNNAAH